MRSTEDQPAQRVKTPSANTESPAILMHVGQPWRGWGLLHNAVPFEALSGRHASELARACYGDKRCQPLALIATEEKRNYLPPKGVDLRMGRTIVRKRRASSIWVWIPALSVLMCACSSGAPSFPSLSSQPATHTVSVAAWDQCLRNSGVTVPAGYDPYSPPPGSTKPNASSKTEAACAAFLPPAPAVPAAVRAKFTLWARCMRAHGIPAPDPTFLPNGNVIESLPIGVGPAMPGYTAAATACGAESGLPALVPGTR